MEYVEALDEIERYKYLTVDSICIPDLGCSISFTLRDAITMRDSFLIIITRGQDTIDISLQQKWDFLCKRNDTDSAIITRFDYASQPHKDKGRYHVHIGSDEHGGRTLAMEEVRDILGIENINLQSAILQTHFTQTICYMTMLQKQFEVSYCSSAAIIRMLTISKFYGNIFI